jgi:O-Antigen ligase
VTPQAILISSSQSYQTHPATSPKSRGAALGQNIATLGFLIFAAFAPHSIAGSEIGIGLAALGWLLRSLATGSLGLRSTKLDLPIALFAGLTVASSLLSEEVSISVAKLQSVCLLLVFYLTQAVATRRMIVMMVCVMFVSGIVGTAYSVFDLVRGRGVIVQTISNDSPLRRVHVENGDAIWRVNGRRVYSISDIEGALKNAAPATSISVSMISRGEHVERPGLVLSESERNKGAPSGITSGGRLHRFRASGWTRHYETFSEVLQILALLALGIALAQLRNHGANIRFKLAIAASVVIALGIVLTAMRTVLVAFMIGGFVILLRSAQGKARAIALAILLLVAACGVLFIWQTRAEDALALRDSSASLRLTVARVGASRILLHPVFGHGMDAMHKHWNEWGFPGDQMLGLHSTPLQLAFDRGLPALFCWLWLMFAFWRITSRAEQKVQNSSDTIGYGLLLGATGAIAGFFASSLVNYNFGDAEVVLLFWWLMGAVVVLDPQAHNLHSRKKAVH